ncbi:hypothetical protein RMATCC62417_08066 [Rhizopus microsporus]|nr:hypothetical protein RMATCC62417_08066 [Rhizopus microsporus]
MYIGLFALALGLVAQSTVAVVNPGPKTINGVKYSECASVSTGSTFCKVGQDHSQQTVGLTKRDAHQECFKQPSCWYWCTKDVGATSKRDLDNSCFNASGEVFCQADYPVKGQPPQTSTLSYTYGDKHYSACFTVNHDVWCEVIEAPENPAKYEK